MPDLSPYCKKCHKYAMWPDNQCICNDTPPKPKPKPNKQFESIDSVLFDLKQKLISSQISQSNENNYIASQLVLDRQNCLAKCQRIEFVRNELLLMKHW